VADKPNEHGVHLLFITRWYYACTQWRRPSADRDDPKTGGGGALIKVFLTDWSPATAARR
jgi:hypothetical protein